MNKESDNSYTIEYKSIGAKFDIFKEYAKAIPPQLRPTQKTGYIFWTILITVLTIGILNALLPITNLQFNVNDIAPGETSIFKLDIRVGFPLTFFISSTLTEDPVSVNIWALILDLIIYLIVAYIIDIGINFIMSMKFTKSEEELKTMPTEVELPKTSLSQKATDAIANTIQKKQQQNIQGTTKQSQQTSPPQQSTIPNKKVAQQPPKVPEPSK